jgi:hypothetical protein
MCRALYLASDHPLPIIPLRQTLPDVMFSSTWPVEAQRFHTAELDEAQMCVKKNLSCTYVLNSGSYEGCACGFNQGREYPEVEYDPEELKAAKDSIEELSRYVRETNVLEIYACWIDDESKPVVYHRTVTPDDLASPDFFFRDRELLRIDHAPA